MPRLTAARSAVRSSHALSRCESISHDPDRKKIKFNYLDVRPLVYLDTEETVAIHPAVDASAAGSKDEGVRVRATHHGNAFMSAMLYDPRPHPASQSRPLRRMSSTPYSRFVSSRYPVYVRNHHYCQTWPDSHN